MLLHVCERPKTHSVLRILMTYQVIHASLLSFDDDGDGELSRAEFLVGIRELQLPLRPEEASALFDAFDTSGSGSVSESELELALYRPAPHRVHKSTHTVHLS